MKIVENVYYISDESAEKLKLLVYGIIQGNVIQAQMNEANFTGSLAKEMITMMDLAETARQVIASLFSCL